MTAHQTIESKAPANTADRAMTGAEIVVRGLVDQGVEVLFGYPGGAVLPIYDALFHEPRLQHILVRHEQGATHAAEGYARSSGKPGVVLVTSGPGATNAITGIMDALMDSIPMVVITGQVPTHLIGTDDHFSAENLLDTGGKDIVVCAAASTDLMAEDEGFSLRLSSHPADFLRSGVCFANMTGDAFRVVINRRGVLSIRRSKDFADKYIDAARKFDKVFRKGGVS